jgi:hypothetical protein
MIDSDRPRIYIGLLFCRASFLPVHKYQVRQRSIPVENRGSQQRRQSTKSNDRLCLHLIINHRSPFAVRNSTMSDDEEIDRLQVVGDFKHGSIKCVKLTNFLTYSNVDFNAGPRFVSVHCMSLFLAVLVYLAHTIHLFSD